MWFARVERALVPVTLAGVLATGVLLAGCGGNSDDRGTAGASPSSSAPASNGVSDLEPEAIIEEAIAALGKAESFSIKGDLDDANNKIEFDFKLAGEDAVGSLTMDGAKVEMLRVTGQMYMRLDQAFWKQVAGDDADLMIRLVDDHWLKVSEDDGLGDFFDIADPDELLSFDGKLTRGETKVVNGVDTIGVVESAEDGGTVWVATTGEAYPVLMEGTDKKNRVVFADFGAKFDSLRVPAAAEVIDLDKLTDN